MSGVFYYPLTNQAAIDAIPATVTFTFSDGSTRLGMVVARATGIDLTNIEDSAATTFAVRSVAGNSYAVPGISTVNTDTLLVGGVYRHNSAITTVPTTTSFMTGFQKYNTTPTSTPMIASTSAILGYQSLNTSGPTGAKTITYDQNFTNSGGELVAFRALPAGSVTRPTIMTTVPTVYTANVATNSFTITNPGGLQDGDLLVMSVSAQSSTATADFTSGGWSRISAAFVPSSTAYHITAFYAMPVPTAASVTAPDFTFTCTDAGAGAYRLVATMFVVRGADLGSMTAGVSGYGSATNATTVTTSANGTVTPLALYQQDVEAGTSGAKTLTWNGTASQTSSASMAIRGLGMTDVNNGRAIHYTSAPDTLSNARAYYTSATDTLATPLEVRPVPTGYASVTSMLAGPLFYIAHRGGSREWPEMSLHAYTQSVFWGGWSARDFSCAY